MRAVAFVRTRVPLAVQWLKYQSERGDTNLNKIKITRSSDVVIPASSVVRYSVMGAVREIRFSSAPSREPVTQKVNADFFVDLRNGELIEVQHSDSRAGNLRSVAASLKRGRDMINANVMPSTIKRVRWVTLTYAENMTDTKRLYHDFELLAKKLRYRYGACEYIVCAEPQRRGAWHLHCLFIFKSDAPYIPNEDLRNMWGQGFVNVKALPKDCDNVGAYLTAYLADVPLEEHEGYYSPSDIKEAEIEGADGKKTVKRFVKGARLHMYPVGMQIFRFSRGLQKPESVEMTYADAKKILGSAKPRYSSATTIEIDDKYKNAIAYEQYNISDIGCQDEISF